MSELYPTTFFIKPTVTVIAETTHLQEHMPKNGWAPRT